MGGKRSKSGVNQRRRRGSGEGEPGRRGPVSNPAVAAPDLGAGASSTTSCLQVSRLPDDQLRTWGEPALSPARVLTRVNRLLPRGTWECIERQRALDAAAHRVPEPGHGWMYRERLMDIVRSSLRPLVTELLYSPLGQGEQEMILLIEAVPTLVLWRMTRGVYRFDPTLLEALSETPLGQIPTEVLRRLPEHAPYVDLSSRDWPGYESSQGNSLRGAWITVSSGEQGPPTLEIVGLYDRDEVISYGLDLTHGTLDECLNHTYLKDEEDEAVLQAFRRQQGLPALIPDVAEPVPRLTRITRLMLNLALYLCSDEPDITGVVKTPRPHPKKKYGHMYVAPQQDNMLEVGVRVGGAIRGWREGMRPLREEGSGAGPAKAPHIRRAHWAVRWTGPGREVARLAWLAPTAVGVKNLDALPVHVRAVPDRSGREESA